MGVTRIQLLTNSKLMAGQLSGLYQVKNDKMRAYLDIVRSLAKRLKSAAITLKPRNDLRYTNVLAYFTVALEDDSSRKITIESQENPSIS